MKRRLICISQLWNGGKSSSQIASYVKNRPELLCALGTADIWAPERPSCAQQQHPRLHIPNISRAVIASELLTVFLCVLWDVMLICVSFKRDDAGLVSERDSPTL